MKREIRFRAFGTVNCFYLTEQGWLSKDLICEVSSLNIKNNKCRVLYNGEKNTKEYDTFEFSKCKLMQFTGLKDKNGKEIYEGDILKVTEYDYEWKTTVRDYHGTLIIDVNGCDWNTTALSFLDDEAETEVIGNIYENPELL